MVGFKVRAFSVACAFVAAAAAAPASAVPLVLLQFTSASSQLPNFSWKISEAPNPNLIFAIPGLFFEDRNQVTLNVTGPPCPVQSCQDYSPIIAFFSSKFGGGFFLGSNSQLFSSNQFQLSGPQLFSGETTRPQLLPGVYDLGLADPLKPELGGGPTVGTLRISVASGVPEPASWALMISGLAIIGSRLRRRAVHSLNVLKQI